MSDEPKSDDKPVGEWVMPEPVYRTSPGRPPKGVRQTDSADEIPTEPGFHNAPTLETEGLPRDDEDETPTSESVKVMAAPLKPKKRGCARSFLTIVSVVALAVISVVIALIYFIFYYKSADNSTF